MKRKTIIPVSIVVAILVLWYIFAPRISWDGGAVGRITVTVVDEQLRAPIRDAIVELRRPRREEASPSFSPEFYGKLVAEAYTDGSGTARITTVFGAGGTTGPFGRSGRVSYSNIWLQVSADGYETARTPLSRYTGKTRSVRRSQDTKITIRLPMAPNEP